MRAFSPLILATVLAGCGLFHRGPGDTDAVAGTWRLTGATLGDSAYLPPPGEDNVLRLTPGGRAEARACNSCGGRYRADGGALTFRDVNCTLMYCPDRIELGALMDGAPVRYRLDAGRLVLTHDAGASVYTFERAE